MRFEKLDGNMKKLAFFLMITSVALFFGYDNLFRSQKTFSEEKRSEIEDNYKKLYSPDFEERDRAVDFFYHLKKEDISEKIVKALVDLFRMEEERNTKVNEFFGKGGTADRLPKDIAYVNSRPYGLYYLYLCKLASRSKEKSLLSLLLRSCWDPEAMANFGDDAVGPVIDALKKPGNPGGRMTIMQILGEMLKPKETGYVASGDTRNRIKEALIQATKDSDRYVRSAAVRALGDSRDRDVTPMLENIAKNDPYSVVVKDASGKEVKRYPVREDAEKALQKLKAKESEKK